VRAFHAVFSRWRRPCATFLLCAARLFFLRQMGLALAARAPPRQLFRARVAGARGPAPSAPYPLPWRLRGVGEGAREPANNPYLRAPPPRPGSSGTTGVANSPRLRLPAVVRHFLRPAFLTMPICPAFLASLYILPAFQIFKYDLRGLENTE
jgi:hypothetical protein